MHQTPSEGLEGPMGWPATLPLTPCSHCSGLPSALQLCQAPSLPGDLAFDGPSAWKLCECSYGQLLVSHKESILQEASPPLLNPCLSPCFILFVVSSSTPKLSTFLDCFTQENISSYSCILRAYRVSGMWQVFNK